MSRSFDAVDDALDARTQWNRVLDVVCNESVFSDNEVVVWIYWLLGVPTDEIARLVCHEDGAPLSRQRVDQLVRQSLGKLFATLDAGPPPRPAAITRAPVRKRRRDR